MVKRQNLPQKKPGARLIAAPILAFTLLMFFNLGCQTTSRNPAPKQFTVTQKWVRYTPEKLYLGFRRPHRMPPVLYKALVIEGNSIDGLVAYDQISGNQRWRLPIQGGVEAGAELVDGHLYFGANDGLFYAIKAETGEVIWTFPLRFEGLSRPFVDQGIIYVLAGNNVLFALDAKTGQQKWLYNRRDSSNLSIRGGSQPNVLGQMVYAGFSDGFLVALDKASGQLLWEKRINRNKRFRDVDAHPVISGDRLYITGFDGALYCLRSQDGQVIWSLNLGGFYSPLISENQLFYSTSNDAVLALDRESGKVQWKITTKGLSSQPQVHRGLVIFGESSGSLRIVDRTNGQDVGLYHPGRGVSSRATIDPQTNRVYFMSVDANLFAMSLDWKYLHSFWPWDKN